MMDEELRQQIRNQFQEYSTDELVDIWTANDRVEWSDLAFEVMAEILRGRLGRLPVQDEPVYEYPDEQDEEESDADEPDDRMDEEAGQPVFYQPAEVLSLSKSLEWAAIAGVAVTILVKLPGLYSLKNTVLSNFVNSAHPAGELWAWIITLVLGALGIGLSCFVVYFSLWTLASILNILMEMEFNSRGVR